MQEIAKGAFILVLQTENLKVSYFNTASTTGLSTEVENIVSNRGCKHLRFSSFAYFFLAFSSEYKRSAPNISVGAFIRSCQISLSGPVVEVYVYVISQIDLDTMSPFS